MFTRLLQVEHRNTERLTEQIERRVGSETSSLDGSINSKDSTENKLEERRLKLNLTSDSFTKSDVFMCFFFFCYFEIFKIFAFRNLICRA